MRIGENAEFYLVEADYDKAPIRQFREFGYDSKWDFYLALRKVGERWRDRVGECIDQRHGFRKLRFHDTPGGKPDEEWIANFLLVRTEMPEWIREALKPVDPIEKELDEAFGLYD